MIQATGVYPTDIHSIDEARVEALQEEDQEYSLENRGSELTVAKICLTILYYLFFPITYPCRKLCELLLNITVFPMSLHHSAFGRWILETFANTHIDIDRITETKRAMVDLGAELTTVITDDNQQIEVMRMTQENFRERVVRMGGEFRSQDLNGNTQEIIDCKNNEPLITTLKKVGWKEINNGSGIFEFSYRQGTESVASTERKVVLRCHPHVHHYTFEKKYLVNHLAMGLDVVFYDTRGLSSTRYGPSEEGMYMDVDAVYRQMRDHWGYQGKDIWVTARCSGTTQASYLRHRYQDDGVNVVYENPFERFAGFIARLVWPINIMNLSAMDSVRSSDELTKAQADALGYARYVDEFDNIRKLQAMPRKLDSSRVVVISTDNDKSIGEGPADKVAKAAARTAEVFHLKHRGTDPQADGHFEDVFTTDAPLCAVYSQLITGQQYLSNFR